MLVVAGTLYFYFRITREGDDSIRLPAKVIGLP